MIVIGSPREEIEGFLAPGHMVELTRALSAMANVQTVLSHAAPDGGWHDKERAEALRTYGWALTEEIHELIREIGWKPWKDNKPPDPAAVLKEFGDVMAFFGVLTALTMEAIGVNAWDLSESYRWVSLDNARRFEQTLEARRLAATE